MPAFATRLVEIEREVDERLSDFGLTRGQILAIAQVAKTWADDASPLMPTNAPRDSCLHLRSSGTSASVP